VLPPPDGQEVMIPKSVGGAGPSSTSKHAQAQCRMHPHATAALGPGHHGSTTKLPMTAAATKRRSPVPHAAPSKRYLDESVAYPAAAPRSATTAFFQPGAVCGVPWCAVAVRPSGRPAVSATGLAFEGSGGLGMESDRQAVTGCYCSRVPPPGAGLSPAVRVSTPRCSSGR